MPRDRLWKPAFWPVHVLDALELDLQRVGNERDRLVQGIAVGVLDLARRQPDAAFLVHARAPVPHLRDPLGEHPVDADTACTPHHREHVEQKPRVPPGADDPGAAGPRAPVQPGGAFPAERGDRVDHPGKRDHILAPLREMAEVPGDRRRVAKAAVEH
jgi:hypothetical protein